MIKSRAIFLAFILVFSIGIPRVWVNHLEIVSSEDKEQIITTVKAYFEHRYRFHSTLQLEDFKGLVDDVSSEDQITSTAIPSTPYPFPEGYTPPPGQYPPPLTSTQLP